MVEPRALLLAIGYLGALLWGAYEWQRPPASTPPLNGRVAVDLPTWQLPAIAIGEREAFDAILERPLFMADRRPAPPAASGPLDDQVTTGSTSPLSDGIRLTGVSTEGERRIALIEHSDGTAKNMRVGAIVEGWKVREIQDDRVVLSGDGRDHALEVYRFDATVPPRLAAGARPVGPRSSQR